MIETVTIRETVDESQQGSFLSLPFSVPANIERLNIRLEVDNDEDHTIDLGIADPHHVRGWSGGARKSVYLRRDRATPGYDPDVIYDGIWSVLLNAYEIKIRCKIKVVIEMVHKHFRWVKGDLHLHTYHSDGTLPVTDVMRNAKEEKLDFIALTDHNTFTQNKAIDRTIDLAVIPGVELTTNSGHANFYGVDKPFKDFRCTSTEDVENVLEEGKINRALISVNHPHCDFCPWEWGLDALQFHFVEIWNGFWKESNRRTLEWWQGELEKGKKITAVGGSDKHGPHQEVGYGMPTTSIYTNSLDADSLLKGLSEGRAAVLSHPEAQQITFTLEGKEAGQAVDLSHHGRELLLTCGVQDAEEKLLLRIYNKSGLYTKAELQTDNKSVQFNVPANAGFYRAELWKYNERYSDFIPECITNPIYIEDNSY